MFPNSARDTARKISRRLYRRPYRSQIIDQDVAKSPVTRTRLHVDVQHAAVHIHGAFVVVVVHRPDLAEILDGSLCVCRKNDIFLPNYRTPWSGMPSFSELSSLALPYPKSSVVTNHVVGSDLSVFVARVAIYVPTAAEIFALRFSSITGMILASSLRFCFVIFSHKFFRVLKLINVSCGLSSVLTYFNLSP